jgi:hypothetical protein
MHIALIEDLDDEKTPVQIALDFKQTMSELKSEMMIGERKTILRILSEIMEIVE